MKKIFTTMKDDTNTAQPSWKHEDHAANPSWKHEDHVTVEAPVASFRWDAGETSPEAGFELYPGLFIPWNTTVFVYANGEGHSYTASTKRAIKLSFKDASMDFTEAYASRENGISLRELKHVDMSNLRNYLRKLSYSYHISNGLMTVRDTKSVLQTLYKSMVQDIPGLRNTFLNMEGEIEYMNSLKEFINSIA